MVGWLHQSMDMSLRKLQELVIGKPGVLQSMRSQRVGHDLATEHACLRYLINLLSSKVP